MSKILSIDSIPSMAGLGYSMFSLDSKAGVEGSLIIVMIERVVEGIHSENDNNKVLIKHGKCCIHTYMHGVRMYDTYGGGRSESYA